jgi:hypothetical protein
MEKDSYLDIHALTNSTPENSKKTEMNVSIKFMFQWIQTHNFSLFKMNFPNYFDTYSARLLIDNIMFNTFYNIIH